MKTEKFINDNDLYVSFRVPEHLRIGQALYLFLFFCYDKGYMPGLERTNAFEWNEMAEAFEEAPLEDVPIGDPFSISDADFAGYYNEWLKYIEQNNPVKDGQQSKENTD